MDTTFLKLDVTSTLAIETPDYSFYEATEAPLVPSEDPPESWDQQREEEEGSSTPGEMEEGGRSGEYIVHQPIIAAASNPNLDCSMMTNTH